MERRSVEAIFGALNAARFPVADGIEGTSSGSTT
jgi:hypothetical protein